MYTRSVLTIAIVVLAMLPVACGVPQDGTPGTNNNESRGGSYDDLAALFNEFRELERPEPVDGVPDYTAPTIERQYSELRNLQAQLAEFDINDWPISEQIDYHLVRAEMNGLEFFHRVMKPWSTDPYVYWGSSTSTSRPYYGFSDRPAVPEGPGWGELGFDGKPSFPLSSEEVDAYGVRLRALPRILAQGKANISVTEAKHDMALITRRALAVEGELLGEMIAPMKEHHPELVADTEAAWAAVQDYRDWIDENLDKMTAPTGVGTENLNWWLKNVWLLPYGWDEIWTHASSEYDRGLATLKLEEYRNRDLPPLEPAATEEEYLRRHQEAEDHLRRFLLEGEFLTVSADDLAAAYAAYPARPAKSVNQVYEAPSQPRNFLAGIIHEHLGHQLDAIRPITNLSPIRATRRLHEMTHPRREGVANGLGEMLMQAGIFDNDPRMREELAMRAANTSVRAMGDLKFQANELDYAGWNQFEADMSIYGSITLDDSEWWNAGANYNTWDHKKDAVHGPGYELAYLTGFTQFYKLLADRANQLGKDFVMRDFMDEFFAAGQIPVALIRWEMTGLTDEVEKLWQ